MKHQWTKFDEFKYQFGRNIKTMLIALLVFGGFAAYGLDVPVHTEYVPAAITGETYNQRVDGAKRVVAATLDNGQQVRLKSFFDPQTKIGAQVKLDKRISPIFGGTSYYFVEYVE